MTTEIIENEEWVLNTDNGLIFAVNPLMQMKSSFRPYSPTKDEIAAGRKLSPILPEPVTTGFDARKAAIKAAVDATATSDYASPAFGRPAMPKVSDIKKTTGIEDVTVEDVAAAMQGE
jgi:hypothetical protein